MHPHLLQSLLHPHLLQSLLHLHLLQSQLHFYLFFWEQLMLHDYMYGYLKDIELHVYVEFYLHQFHLTWQLM